MADAKGGEPGGSPTTRQVARKLFPLYFTHVNQAILVTMPFTIAVYMVRDFGARGRETASEQTIGKLTGALGSVFCAAQLLTSIPWGMVSDRIGRKPVLLVGNVSCVLSAVLFGLAGTFWQAVVARVIGGAFNAIILCEKSMIGEGLPDKPSQAKAFGLLSLCWGLGSLAGPIIGGSLSAPCSSGLRVAALCQDSSLLVHRPYFLPCLLAGLLSAAATVMAAFGLEETLPGRRTLAGSGGSGGGVALYQHVPASDDADMAGTAAGREVELSGLRQQQLQQQQQHGSSDGGSNGGTGGSSSWRKLGLEANGTLAVIGGSNYGGSSSSSSQGGGHRFRSDSAHVSPVATESAAAAAAAAKGGKPDGGGGGDADSSSGSGSSGGGQRRSMDSMESLDIVVLGLGDVEQQQQQDRDSLLPRSPLHTSAAADPAEAEAKAAAAKAAAVVPWYKERTIVLALIGYGLIAWCYNMLDEITPIFASAPVPQGGLGYSPSQLAPSLSFGGLVLVVWALRGFPWLMRRVGVVRALRLGLWQTAPLALLIPATSVFGGAALPSQALMFAAMGLKAIAGTNAFTACLILVNAAAPVGSLGAVNGVGQSLASLVRALGPALGGMSWAWSNQLAELAWWPAWLPHQYLPFALAALLCLGTDLVYWNIRMPEAEEIGGGGSSRSGGGGSSTP